MARRREEPLLDVIFEMLKYFPFWVGPILALVVFLLLRLLVPSFITTDKNSGELLRSVCGLLSWLMGGAILLAWGMAELWKFKNRYLLASQTGLGSIRAMAWQDFERLICEAYRCQGYSAEVVGNRGGDGGVDVVLHGHGQKVMVQCKQWRTYKVGVTTVRELLGVVVSAHADKGILVTSGRLTTEAHRFVRESPQLEVIDGPRLVALIQSAQQGKVVNRSQPEARTTTPVPCCPLCNSEMILRTARQGIRAGTQFWGCPRYPTCKGTRAYVASDSR
ncbi:MAG: restriction endonuclease [Phycisphaerae bacterium]